MSRTRVPRLGTREGANRLVVESNVVDLSGTGATEIVMVADRPYTILSAALVFTEASSADTGNAITVGKQIVGTDDADYFVVSVTTSVSQETAAQQALTLAQKGVAKGDVITFTFAGGKTGTGECVLHMILQE